MLSDTYCGKLCILPVPSDMVSVGCLFAGLCGQRHNCNNLSTTFVAGKRFAIRRAQTKRRLSRKGCDILMNEQSCTFIKKKILIPYICAAVFHALCIPVLVACCWGLIHDALSTNIDQGYLFFKNFGAALKAVIVSGLLVGSGNLVLLLNYWRLLWGILLDWKRMETEICLVDFEHPLTRIDVNVWSKKFCYSVLSKVKPKRNGKTFYERCYLAANLHYLDSQTEKECRLYKLSDIETHRKLYCELTYLKHSKIVISGTTKWRA